MTTHPPLPLYQKAPDNLIMEPGKMPNTFPTRIMNGAVYRERKVKVVDYDAANGDGLSCCSCFDVFKSFVGVRPLLPREKNIGLYDLGETKRIFKEDFPFMNSFYETDNFQGLKTRFIVEDVHIEQAIIKSSRSSSCEELRKTSEAQDEKGVFSFFQFSLIRGQQLGITYAMVTRVSDQNPQDWRTVNNYKLYYCKDGFDEKGNPIPLEAIQNRVRETIKTFQDAGFQLEGPLDYSKKFRKCDDDCYFI